MDSHVYTHDGYDHFSGNFRPLDLLAQRDFIINSEYRNEDNVYEFSNDEFILSSMEQVPI